MAGKERKLRALFVGVEDYQDKAIHKLQYAIEDAFVLREVFNKLGFQTNSLQNPSQEQVLKAIAQSTKGLGSGDLFLFFFSGHGFSVAGEDLVFCPENWKKDLNSGANAGLSYTLLKGRTAVDGGRQQFDRIFLFDTCRSYLTGVKGFGGSGIVTLDDGKQINTKDLRPMEEFTAGMGGSVFVLRSCSSGQESLEMPNATGSGNGLFTLSLKATLEDYICSHRPIAFDDRFYGLVKSKMKAIKIANQQSGWQQTPERRHSGDIICLGNDSLPCDGWMVLDYPGVYDGGRHGIEFLGKLPDEASISYSTDEGRTWVTDNPLFMDAGTYSVRFRIESKGREPVEGERSVTIEPRPLLLRMLRSKRVDMADDDGLRPVLKLCDAAPCRLVEADWTIIAVERREKDLNVTVEGRRNYCGRLTLSIPIPSERPPIVGDGSVTDDLRNLCDRYRVMLTESAAFHSDPAQNRPDLAKKLIGWQGELYVISGGARRRATIRVAELDKLISEVINEYRAFRREFDTVPFFIEHQRQRVELIAKKLLNDSVAEIFYKSVTIQMEDE